jgi:hypothetical protein
MVWRFGAVNNLATIIEHATHPQHAYHGRSKSNMNSKTYSDFSKKRGSREREPHKENSSIERPTNAGA